MVKASYEDLFLFRDRNAPGVPIFGHCYDFAIPNGKHPICAGPRLLPSLKGVTLRIPFGLYSVKPLHMGARRQAAVQAFWEAYARRTGATLVWGGGRGAVA